MVTWLRGSGWAARWSNPPHRFGLRPHQPAQHPLCLHQQYRLHLTLGASSSYSLALPLNGLSGTVTIPRDKMLPGKRDLTFTLTRKGQASTFSTQHAAHMNDVAIYGPK